ncbi:hypothetical protein ACWD25_61915 [Streptomyces sp. NPDC002920]
MQILPLPEGAGDDRPPFVLVIDEAATGPDGELLIKAADYIEAREHIGACDVFIFEETVEIPANEPLPLPEVDDAERAGTTQIVDAHERTRLDLCDALLLSRDTTWRKLVEQVGERQRELAGLYRRLDQAAPDDPAARKPALTDALGMDRLRDWDDIVNAARGLRRERDSLAAALERVRDLPERPEVLAVIPEQPYASMDGYAAGIRDAKSAARGDQAPEGGD